MEGFADLYFTRDAIPDNMSEGVEEISFISEDKETCCRYVLLLAKTCQVKNITKLCLSGGWGGALQTFCQTLQNPAPPPIRNGDKGGCRSGCSLTRHFLLLYECLDHQRADWPQVERGPWAGYALHVASGVGHLDER